jgi:hypothetical protein
MTNKTPFIIHNDKGGLMYHHSRNHHYHYRPKKVDLYLELSIVLKKLAALNAIIPQNDPLPFVVELTISQESGEFIILPEVKESY